MSEQTQQPKILILGTLSGGYAGADSTGQSHLEYPANTYILPVRSPVMFPPEFYLRAFEHGMGAHNALTTRGIQPILTDIQEIEPAVKAYIDGQLVDHPEWLH